MHKLSGELYARAYRAYSIALNDDDDDRWRVADTYAVAVCSARTRIERDADVADDSPILLGYDDALENLAEAVWVHESVVGLGDVEDTDDWSHALLWAVEVVAFTEGSSMADLPRVCRQTVDLMRAFDGLCVVDVLKALCDD